MDKKFGELWFQLYATLTTSQIETALKNAKMKHEDWMQFTQQMKALREK